MPVPATSNNSPRVIVLPIMVLVLINLTLLTVVRPAPWARVFLACQLFGTAWVMVWMVRALRRRPGSGRPGTSNSPGL
ncbi:hypothetical protein GCM10007170_45290 [Arthrobacter liuii]|uniref:Uncharacterized protein n=1 Tax=Arthrobacter liuii TaxID=1476996 RepID=A0ABQ2AZD7_9MICC|nr:hypothetical protein GCM10007170_45290 [Arthrobacter liuii]